MYCPQCGSEVTGARCTVCGNQVGLNPPSDLGSSVQLAGWWRRVGATLTDELILVMPVYLVALFGGAVGGNLGAFVVGAALQGFYMVGFLSSSRGQTLGNRMAASQVRDALTGQSISRQQALRRWGFIAAYGALSLGGTSMSYITLLLGLIDVLMPLFDPRKRTLHDKFAGTVVVKV